MAPIERAKGLLICKRESLGLHRDLVPHPWDLPRKPLFEPLGSGGHPRSSGVEVSAILQDPGHVAQELCQAVVFTSVHAGLND